MMAVLTPIFLVNCGTVEIKDSEWVGSLGAVGGVSYHTLTDETHDLSHDEIIAKWNDLSKPQVMTSVDTLTEWKSDIEKLCSNSGQCTYEQIKTQKKLLDFLDNIKGFSAKE